jgi:hypothetical protein
VRVPSALAVLALALAGCAGSPAAVGPGDGTDPLDTVLGARDTLDGFLNRTRHTRVDGISSYKLEYKPGGSGPEAFGGIVYFSRTVSGGEFRQTGNPHLVALIPLKTAQDVDSCNAMPADTKFYFRPLHGNQFATNLTGKYGPGWYHLVVVADQAGTFTATFNATKEQKLRNFLPGNPWINGSYVSKSGSREHSLDVQVGEGTWYAWANHRMSGPGVDGGRQHAVSVDCRESKRTSGTSDVAFTQQQRLHTRGVGNTPFDIKGSYRPNVANSGPSNTILEAAWIHIAPVVAPPAET